MKIYMADRQSIIVEHQRQRLEFFIHRTFNKTNLIESYRPGGGDCFDVINQFLETLSPDRAEKLFRQYQRFMDNRQYHMESVFSDHMERDNTYRRIVKELFTIVDYESVYDWMDENVKIVYPPNVEEVVGEGLDPDRTYIQQDFKELTAMGLAFRLVVPFFAQYISDHGDAIGNDRKELMALKLLDMTEIIYSRPYERFVLFVESVNACVENTKNTYKTMIGVGSEDQAEIGKARKIVRRVSFIDPYAADGIIQAVFNEIKNQPTDTQRSQHKIKDKKKTASRSDDEETSVIEHYRIKESLPKADTLAISYYLESLLYLQSTEETFTRKEIKLLRGLIDELIKDGHEMDKHNLMMAQFFVTGVPPESIEVVDREFQIAACVSVYGLMVKWELYDLALMAIGKLEENTDDMGPTISSNRSTIPAELDRQLDELYPYRRKVKQNANVCKEAISKLFSEVSGCLIRPIYCPEHHEFFKDRILHQGFFAAPRTVSVDLATAIVKIHSK